MSMQLISSAFRHQEDIPRRHTCDGENVSPPLAWSGQPAETKSLALIVDDPDVPDPAAPKRVWVHWVLYNIPPTLTSLSENRIASSLPAGIQVGLNDWKKPAYGGPCPPVGRHRYFHKLYALDVVLPDLHLPAKPALEAAMRGHILAQAELIGLYQRS
jgi:Raf kinase inhibitor-like YbhB/YbcL family protein